MRLMVAVWIVPALLLAALSPWLAPAREAAPANVLAAGEGADAALGPSRPFVDYVIDVPSSATAFVVVAMGSCDADLYVRRDRPFVLDPVREADALAQREGTFERLEVRGRTVPGRWHLRVSAPQLHEPHVCSVIWRVDSVAGPDLWLPEELYAIREVERRSERIERPVWIPTPHAELNVRLTREGGSVQGATAWAWALEDADGVRYGDGPHDLDDELRHAADGTTFGAAAPFVGRLVLERRKGAPRTSDAPPAVWIDCAAAPRSPDARLVREGEPATLRIGSDGERTAHARLRLREPVPGLRIAAIPESPTDIDVYVRRGRPSVRFTQDAEWFALSTELAAERFAIGGSQPLPAGDYYFTIECVDGEAMPVKVKLQVDVARHPVAFPGAEGNGAALEPDVWRDGRVGAEAGGITWHGLLVPAGTRTLELALGDAAAPLELLVAHPGDGAIVARAVSGAVDERLQLHFGAGTAEPTPIAVGVLLLDPWENDVDYRLAAAFDRPAPEWTSPRPGLVRGARHALARALSSTVELTLRDGSGGSGTCLTPRGHLLTCRHVLELEDEGDLQRDGVLVAFSTRIDRPPIQMYRAEVLATSEELDLALLVLRTDLAGRPFKPDESFPHIELGAPNELDLGDDVVVLGYPADGSDRSRTPILFTRGVVAGLESTRQNDLRWIKTDAWVGSGHSGGALLDAKGRLVGIPALSLGAVESLGMAVPTSAIPASWWGLMDIER